MSHVSSFNTLTGNITTDALGANVVANTMATSSTIAQSTKVTGDAAVRHDVLASGKHEWGDGTSAVDTNLYRSAADTLATDDDLSFATLGKTVKIKTGSNAKSGTVTCNGTTEVVVSTTAVTANSIVMLGGNAPAGTPAAAYVFAVTPGTSFSIKSAASNTSVMGWWIVEMAA